MKKIISMFLVLLMAFPAFAEDIDLSGMAYEELVALRERIDEQIATLDAQNQTEEEPDYSAMTIDDAFAAIGAISANTECTYRSYEFWEDNYYVIHIDLCTPFSYESGLVNAIRYTIDFGRRAYPLQGVNTLRFVFHQQAVDKYGNSSDGTPIIWKIHKVTFDKMNIDSFYENTYANSKRFMNSCDSAAVFAAYKNAAQ